ncbi:MAG: multiheme c-type cytochrome [Polyangiales bacterium]
MSRPAAWFLASALVAACSSEAKPEAGGRPALRELAAPTLTAEQLQLRDPETCKGCHPAHYREWSSSMHAYAAKDPVFLAMNQRGQRETNGALGDFCINCHAPMAVRDGLTHDGLNIAQLDDFERGVSCYFCHNVTAIEGDHNGKLSIANDTTMRGPLRDAIPSAAHGSAYSSLLDEDTPSSSAMCGACHDVVTPAGVALERSFKEYKHGIFSKSAPGSTLAFDSCVGCHMPPKPGVAAEVAGAPERTLHEHLWPGVDVPLTAFPNSAALRSAVEDCELSRSVQFFKLEVTPPDLFTFQIETGAGHNQPSGAAQDRRMWLEFLAYDASGNLLESVSSGNIAEGELEEKPVGDPKHDPNLFMLRDRIYDAEGKQAHMFWDARKSAAYPDGHASSVLPVATTTYVEGQNAVVKQYRARGPDGKLPARVTARLRIRPIGLDTLQDLVASGDLDPAVVKAMPTLTFGAQIAWTPADGLLKTISSKLTSDCDSYRCMLDPDSPQCTTTRDTE